MLTWHLWRAVHNPPKDSPLFRRFATERHTTGRLIKTLRMTALYLSLCVTFALLWPLLVANLFSTALMVIVVANTVYGMIWATTVSATIAHEHEQNTYELLCLLPSGESGAAWTLSTIQPYANSLFRAVSLIVQVLAFAAIGALLIALVIPLMMLLPPGAGEQTGITFGLIAALLSGLVLVLGLYTDHVQSVILAHLIGMLIPIQTPSRLNARLWTLGLFLLIQVLVYLVTLILFFMTAANLSGDHPGTPLIVGLPIVRLALFYITREIPIIALWRLLNSRLNTGTPRPGSSHSFSDLTMGNKKG